MHHHLFGLKLLCVTQGLLGQQAAFHLVRRELLRIGSGLPLVDWPLPPLPYRPGVLQIMAVGIEPEAMPEARLPREMLFGHASNVVEEPAVRFIQLPQDVGERKAPFLFRHLCIEGIDAAILDVSRWSASCEDERQILQRLLLPCGHMRKDVFHRPIAHDASLRQLCI